METRHELINLPYQNIRQLDDQIKDFLHNFADKYHLVILDQPDTKLWSLIHPPESILQHCKIVDSRNVTIAEFLVLRYTNGFLGLDMKTQIEIGSKFPKSFTGNDFLDKFVAQLDPKQKYRPLHSKIYNTAHETITNIDYLKTNTVLFVEWLATQPFGADFPLSLPDTSELDNC